MSDELITWLRQQIDDDERVAQAAPGPKWQATVEREGKPGHWVGIRANLVTLADDPVTPEDPAEILRAERVVDRLGSQANAVHHVVRWDPARVLAEVEAKRRILALHESYSGYGDHCQTCQNPDDDLVGEPWPCTTLRLLAQPYAGRDGWQEQWRV